MSKIDELYASAEFQPYIRKIHELEAKLETAKKELKRVKEHNKLATKLLLERNGQIEAANKELQRFIEFRKQGVWDWKEETRFADGCIKKVISLLKVPRKEEVCPSCGCNIDDGHAHCCNRKENTT
jgi:chromosome segregation ATPase